MPFKSQLLPGIYHIRNAGYNSHAVLYNDDEPTSLYSDVLRDPNVTEDPSVSVVEGKKAGPKWRIVVLSNSMYAIFNDSYKTYAIQTDVLSFGPTDSIIRASSHDDNLSRRAWRIEFVSAGQFIVCDYKCSTCWELRSEVLGSPLYISAYVQGRKEQLWMFERVDGVSSNGMPGQGSIPKSLVLSLDGSGLYGISGLIVLERMMQMLADHKDQPLVPSDVFELIGGTSSGGLIAILLGRLGLDCATAWREYANMLANLSPVEHCDLVSHDNYATVLREIVKRYTEQRNARMEAPVKKSGKSSGVGRVNTFVTTMQVRETPRISCIRSYDAPRGDPDSALSYEWMILEAAMATCARHPYSPPLRIQDEIEITKIIPCRDPSLMGHSNPIRMAAAEAECLFGKGDSKTTSVYISLGAGRPASEDFVHAVEHRPDAEQSVATMFHSIATREAEGTHATLGTRFPSRTCFRLCPQLALDHTKINDPHEIELATTKWLDSREGRTQMRSVVEALLGVPLLAEPPAPPEDIAQGYNPIFDRARPNDIDHWLKGYRVVYLVDDSSSMEPHWQEVASALAGIAQESRGNDANSFSIRFIKSTRQENGVASPAAVISAMQNIQPFGSNVLGPRLEEILQEQIQTIDASIQRSQYAEVKPLHIVVLTTGDFPDYLQNVLANVGQQKASKNLHPNSLKIQFVLVGDSPTGASHLRDVQAFDPGHVVDVSLSFGDFSAGRLKHNLLSTLQPNTVSTLAPAQTSVPFLFPSEPSDGIFPPPQMPAPRIQSPRAQTPRMQAPRVATPQQTTYEPEEGTPIVSVNPMPEQPPFFSVGAGPLPGGHGVVRMHTTVHSPLGMSPEAMLQPQNFQNLQGRGGFRF